MLDVGGLLRTRINALVVGGATFAVAAVPALAADLSMKDSPVPALPSDFTYSAYVQGVSDYIFRGVSNGKRQAQLQGGGEVDYKEFYVGTFLSGVNFNSSIANRTGLGFENQDSKLETDLYVGWRPKLGDLSLDLGFLLYAYPGTDVRNPYNFDPTYIEWKASASYTVPASYGFLKDSTLTGTFYYSPDYFSQAGQAITIEGGISKSLYKWKDTELTGSGQVGGSFFDQAALPPIATSAPGIVPLVLINGLPNVDYAYWNIGATFTYKTNFSVDLRYWDSTLNLNENPAADGTVFQAGSAFAATVKYAVP